ncbi:MAG TPA: TonB-dependent receptor [Bacteroidales bacterium]|nr:TonB-dependent receptor [Bacteroidales bacterium]
MKHFTLLLISLIAFSGSIWGQKKMVTGKVTDEKGGSLPGVTIQVKGTYTGTVTDLDGNYKIEVEDSDVLIFSFVGFNKQEIPVGSQTVINVVLTEETTVLSEIVVIGYGAQQKKDLTTAVAVVNEKDFRDRPIISAAQALQGKAAGVQVVQPSGKPGQQLAVRVRGATSVLAGNDPLYVVDGVPTTDIRGLNPNDISSMTILKDASSSAIYGARAANGVVLITTKRGQEGEPLVTFSTYFGMSNLRKNIDVLNTKQYRDLMEEILPGGLDPTMTYFNNWPDYVFGTGYTQSYQFSVSGGSSKSKYYVAGGYLSDKGIVKPARFDRYNFRINFDSEMKSWLKLTSNINVLGIDTKDTPDNLSSGRGGVIMSALNTPPFLHVYKQDGSGQYDPNPFQPSWENPAAYMYGPDQQSTDYQVFGNIGLEARIVKDLYFKTHVGTDITTHQWDYYLDPFRTNYGRNMNGIGRSDKYNNLTWLWENTLDYKFIVGKHNFTALAGASIQKFQGNDSYIEGNDFPADTNVRTLWAANNITAGTTREEWALASFFGRVTWDYLSKYYLTMSIRHDGSSKLAHHWGTMPSFSAGWRVSSEEFMKNLTFIDDLKIRGGWGKNGNQEGIPNYARYGLINYYRREITDPLSGPAAVQITYGNPDLKWETTAQTNIGFDLTMFHSRVTLNFDYYYKKTSDVILDVQLPNSLPITSIQTNAGEIENKGIELNLNTINVDKNWKWTTDFNIAFNTNKVLSLKFTDVYYFGRIYSNNSDVVILRAGLPLGSFYGYISEGVDPATGDLIYKDVNNNGILDPGDRTVIGDPNPDFIFGLTNSFSYKKWDFSFFFQGSVGNDIYNATRIDLEGMFDSKNQSTAVLNRWTPENPYTDIPRAVGGGNMDNVRNSTRFVEDGTYVRLKSLTLSYKIIDKPSKKTGISRLSIYLTGNNLLTFTGYSGFDPEVNAYGNSAVEVGIDYGTYPQARSLMLGLNVEF